MSRASPGRRAVARVIREATRPLSADQVAAATGLPMADVRMHLSNLKLAGTIANVGTAHDAQYQHTSAAGAWAAATTGSAPTPPRTRMGSGTYTGAELQPYTGRPGAMDAYALPSLSDGQRVPRRAPIIIGAQPARKAVQP
jgi:hypothetical protein